jgi:hypothetical protein
MTLVDTPHDGNNGSLRPNFRTIDTDTKDTDDRDEQSSFLKADGGKLGRREPLFPSWGVSTNVMEDAEDTVDAGEDFLDEFGRIMVNVVEDVEFVGMLPPP